MNTEIWIDFFKWCSIINIGLLMLLALMLIRFKDAVYKIHTKMFPIPKESWSTLIYSFLGIYKLFIIVFNIVPYIALLIVLAKDHN